MLYGYILIAHLLCFVLGADQYFVQLLTDINLSAGNFHSLCQMIFRIVHEMLFVDLHLFNQHRDQTIFLTHQGYQQMLLLDFLITIFIS